MEGEREAGEKVNVGRQREVSVNYCLWFGIESVHVEISQQQISEYLVTN